MTNVASAAPVRALELADLPATVRGHVFTYLHDPADTCAKPVPSLVRGLFDKFYRDPAAAESDTGPAIEERAAMWLDTKNPAAAHMMQSDVGVRAFLLTKFLERLQRDLHEEILADNNDDIAWGKLKKQLPQKFDKEHALSPSMAYFLDREITKQSAEAPSLEGPSLAFALTALVSKMPPTIPNPQKIQFIVDVIHQIPRCDDDVKMAVFRLLNTDVVPKTKEVFEALLSVLPKSKTTQTNGLVRSATHHQLGELSQIVHDFASHAEHDEDTVAKAICALREIAEMSETKPDVIAEMWTQLGPLCNGAQLTEMLLIAQETLTKELHAQAVLRSMQEFH